MKKLCVLLSLAALLTACNNKTSTETTNTPPATPEEPAKTEVKVRVETQPEPGVKSIEVDPSGVKIQARDKNGNVIIVDTKDPK